MVVVRPSQGSTVHEQAITRTFVCYPRRARSPGPCTGALIWSTRSDFDYNPASQLDSLFNDIVGTAWDATTEFGYNPAGQIVSAARDNDSYAWPGHVDVTRPYTANGLNQYETVGPSLYDYDANGNLTSDGTSVYLYDVDPSTGSGRLVEKRAQTNGNCSSLSYAGTWEASLRYDPLGRLFHVDGPAPGIFRFVYDGDALALEYNGSGTILRRYVHGADAGADDPLVWYEGSAVNASTRRYMHTDPRGSIVLVTNYQGTQVVHNTYDEYGIPGSTNDGRFQYTGQAWLPELGMYYYKARIYSPTLGRFLQTDPVGYEDQWNLYAYVGNDPVNGVDPTGMREKEEEDQPIPDAPEEEEEENEIVVVAREVVLFLVPGGDAYRCTFKVKCDTIDKVAAAVDLVPGLGKIAKLNKLRKLGKLACGCVVAGTVVQTPDGLRAIEELNIGDLVLAYDVKTNAIVPQPVLDVIKTEPKPTYDVVLRAGNGETARFEATDDHPWLNVAKEWQNTEELTVGDWLIADDGDRFEVVEVYLTGDIEVAYTLTVDTLHTYIMGEAGLVVHNAKCPKIQDLKKASSNKRADEIARQHGYRDAHEAKAGRGDSTVNIYTDKDGNGYLSDGKSPPEPL